ncbi:MAG: hypothetical protein U5K37_09600 [Natrialbaceae archaeon]|nr:hypothetical protein [Natrialbaceae archaeon]
MTSHSGYPTPYLLGRGALITVILAILILGLFAGVMALEPMIQ